METMELIIEPGIPQLVMTREFDAPPEVVFRAFVEPELLARWLGPSRLAMEVEVLEVRHGGRWRFLHRDDEGNVYGFRGVFHGTPSAAAGIVQTWEFEGAPGHVSLQTATFEARGSRTFVRLSSVYQSVEDRDAEVASGMEEGARESMDRLAALVAELARAR